MKTGDVSFSIWIAAVRCLQKLSATRCFFCFFLVSTRPLEHPCFGVDLLPNWTCIPRCKTANIIFVIFSLLKKKAGAVGVSGLFVNDDARAVVSFFFSCVWFCPLWFPVISKHLQSNYCLHSTPLVSIPPTSRFLDEKHTRRGEKRKKEWEKTSQRR